METEILLKRWILSSSHLDMCTNVFMITVSGHVCNALFKLLTVAIGQATQREPIEWGTIGQKSPTIRPIWMFKICVRKLEISNFFKPVASEWTVSPSEDFILHITLNEIVREKQDLASVTRFYISSKITKSHIYLCTYSFWWICQHVGSHLCVVIL
jgi:hypothetical protein